MDKNYDHTQVEGKIYEMWEKGGYFSPRILSGQAPKGKPFTILLPPPNASGRMHTGNVLMIAIEDLLVRYHRMKGDPTLWIPGTDHAGTETQITYEKEIKKERKSRFSFSREELYQNIWSFVQKNRGLIEGQIRQMGASVDWSRYTFTLDPQVVKTVHETFKKMADDDLVYRGNYMVNYCPKCGTTYADVEIKHEERSDPLYYLKYGPFIIATVRPETKFGDSAVAVTPKDKRYKKWVGEEIEIDGLIGKFKVRVIADDFVDMKFGTGVVKVTPAHDKNDYEAGLRHNLEIKQVIGLDGKLNDKTGKYAGLSVFEARKQVVADMKERGMMDHVEKKYIHSVAFCKAGHEIEPTVLPNWFVKVDAPHKSFKKPALEAVKKGKVKIFPKWREITYIRWMEEMRDWPVSRQNVWGIQLPVWHKVDGHEGRIWTTFIDKKGNSHQGPIEQHKKEGFSLDDIQQGIQKVLVPVYDRKENQPEVYIGTDMPKNGNWIQETDTFDTWFSSGQWPLVTLGYPDSDDFKYFYPTAVLETGWEIIRLWVSRMIMFGMYLTGESPFEYVYLHGIVRALDGRKMSKSLGNVINPEEYIEQYGVDALRMGLISGTANGKDFAFPKDRVIAYKHFANKIWNMARFMQMMEAELPKDPKFDLEFDQFVIPTQAQAGIYKNKSRTKSGMTLQPEDKEILKRLSKLIKSVDTSLEKFRMADGAEAIYQFMWHELADAYIEQVKNRQDKEVALSVLRHVYLTSIKLLHPFMPFVTEEILRQLSPKDLPLIIQAWPKD